MKLIKTNQKLCIRNREHDTRKERKDKNNNSRKKSLGWLTKVAMHAGIFIHEIFHAHTLCSTNALNIQHWISKKQRKIHQLPTTCDENQQTFKDPLHVLVGPITKARFKIKETLNGLIQEIWVDSNARHFKFGPKEDEGVINLIQAIEG